jgi:hypothetical protein
MDTLAVLLSRRTGARAYFRFEMLTRDPWDRKMFDFVVPDHGTDDTSGFMM